MPSTESLTDLGVREAADRIRRGEVSSVALVEACLSRVRALEPEVLAWAHVDADGALAAARERDAEAKAGRPRGPLHGVPVGIKDIFDVAGMPTTAGAREFAHTRPTRDSGAVARLRTAGAVILGKTHTTQFAYRDPSPARNPWNRAHTPGGSSSGSAVAVSARMVPGAIGSQTVGSILRPAAFCGVVGLKGPYGHVPVDGAVPLAWSLDHAGPFARSVDDAALLFGVLADRVVEPAAVQAPRLAVGRQLFDRAEPELRRHLDALVERLAAAGARVTELSLPPAFTEILAAGTVVLEVEAATYHQPTFAKYASDYGPGLAEMIPRGLARLATEYVTANRARLAFREAMIPLLEAHDALLSPTAPGVAPAGLGWTGDASLCAPWSSAGVPSISVPTGVDAAGLPLALQLVQAPAGVERLLGAAAWCERVAGFTARPRL
ncbi:MAG TPA: amidase [Candidatus Acidoferrum sp.]|jgi:Asp-tRNA(Asn)/Glu-tRNA(Gln) amidotransferase A subunit family amidase|nr:amidase [Candidatus Acidoferrum sp.]